jgi:gliding motility-associated-like protein
MYKIFFILFFACFSFNLLAQTVFERALGGTGNDSGYGVSLLPDGNYLVLASTTNSGAGGQDISLTKTNANGEILWSKTYGGSSDEYPGMVIPTNDGGLVIVGTTYSFGSGDRDIYVIRTDAAGNLQWSKVYGGNYTERGFVIRQLLDGNFIVGGSEQSNGAGQYDVFIMKINANNGSIIWSRNIGGSLSDTLTDIVLLDGDELLVSGSTSSTIGSDYDFYVARLNASGNLIWHKQIRTDEQEHLFGIFPTTDGGYLCFGHIFLTTWDILAVKLNSAGNIVWAKRYDAGGSDYVNDAIQTTDGNYVTSCFTTSAGNGGNDILLVKFEPDGNVIWAKTYGGAGDENDPFMPGSMVQQTADNGFLIGAQTNSFGSGGMDIYLIKTDDNGNTNNCYQTEFNYNVYNLDVISVTSDLDFSAGTIASNANTVVANYNMTNQLICTIAPLPTAAFTAPITQTCVDNCLSFTDQSTNNPTAWQWTFEGATPNTSSAQNPSNICYLQAGTYNVQLIVSNNVGSDTLLFDDYIVILPNNVSPCAPSPTAAFTAPITQTCVDNCLSFTDQSTNNPTAWQWTFEGATPSTSSAQNPSNICYSQAGTYNVQLIVSNSVGSDTLLFDDYVTISNNQINVNNITLCQGDSLLLQGQYQNQAGTYYDTIYYATNCYNINQTNLNLQVCNNNLTCQLVFPNAFSPNNDGVNDTFMPETNCLINSYDLWIYNRWGEELFWTNNPTDAWNGIYKGIKQELGVYVYKVQYTTIENGILQTKNLKGNISLIK